MEINFFKKRAILLLLAVGLACPVLSQSTQTDSVSFSAPVYSITGKFSFCQSDSVVRTGMVSLMKPGGEVLQQVYTDSKGMYQLTWVNEGDYIIKFERDGEQTTLPVKVQSDLSDQNACIAFQTPAKPSIDSNSATSDIKSGNVQIFICNPGAPLTQALLDKISAKYGFHYTMKGSCMPNSADEKAFDAYNNQVMQYLDTVNKVSWRTDLENELQALVTSLSPQVPKGEELFLN